MRLKLLPVFVLLLFVCCSNNNSSSEIPIGFYGPLSGNIASFGNTVKRGIELGVEELNQGGIHGKKIRLILQDDRGNPEEAQSAVSRLITRDRVIAILGHPSSSGSLAGAPVCQQHRVPMISPTATNAKVTQQGDYIFRVCWIDSYQGEAMAEFAVKNLNARKISILNDVTSDYSSGLAEVFAKRVESLGANIVSHRTYSAGDTNFMAQLTSIKNENPDVLFLPAYYNDAGLILRQIRSLNAPMKVLGTDGWDSPELLEIGGDALNGTYYCTHFLSSDPSPTVQRFVTACRKKYGTEPSAGEALGYDAIRLVAQALKSLSVIDSMKLRDAIAATKDFEGVTGRITIDPSRNARKPLILVHVENGIPKLYQKIEPL